MTPGDGSTGLPGVQPRIFLCACQYSHAYGHTHRRTQVCTEAHTAHKHTGAHTHTQGANHPSTKPHRPSLSPSGRAADAVPGRWGAWAFLPKVLDFAREGQAGRRSASHRVTSRGSWRFGRAPQMDQEKPHHGPWGEANASSPAPRPALAPATRITKSHCTADGLCPACPVPVGSCTTPGR